MGRGPHLGGLGARKAPAWETMGPMRNRLTITKSTTALATSALLVLGLAAARWYRSLRRMDAAAYPTPAGLPR